MPWIYRILAPIEWLSWLSITSFVSLFARTMENKGFDDPVYKKNLQRLIERNRRFEEARNEPHS
jgi:hypothetical protein